MTSVQSIRSLSVVSLGVSAEDVTLLAPDKCPDPPMASSLAGPWPPLPHSSLSLDHDSDFPPYFTSLSLSCSGVGET